MDFRTTRNAGNSPPSRGSVSVDASDKVPKAWQASEIRRSPTFQSDAGTCTEANVGAEGSQFFGRLDAQVLHGQRLGRVT